MKKYPDRLMLDRCEFQMIRIHGFDHLVRGQRYRRLANEPIGDSRFRILVEVHRYYESKKPDLIGYLKGNKQGQALLFPPVFISTFDPECMANRAVFYGNVELELVNLYLVTIGRAKLAEAISRMIHQELAIRDDDNY